jgi:hypothetical protein
VPRVEAEVYREMPDISGVVSAVIFCRRFRMNANRPPRRRTVAGGWECTVIPRFT